MSKVANFKSFLQSIFLCIYFWWNSLYGFVIQFIFPIQKSLKNDVVIITGAASGIGRLLCKSLAPQCSAVIAWDINEDGLEVTKQLVNESCGVMIHCYGCDIGDRDSIETVSRIVLQRHGTVSLIISNAGIIGCTTPVVQQCWHQFERTFRINTMSHFWMVRAFLPAMIANRKGHFAFMTSSAGSYGAPRLSDYCAAKAAATSLCECLDLELSVLGLGDVIHTTCISPFLINTALFRGCTTRFPVLTPCLDAQFVTKRIISAIKCNQKLVCIGRYVYLLNLLKSIVPVDGLMSLYKFSGALNVMDNYED